MESGFAGRETDTRRVLSFTFENDNTTDEEFLLMPGYKGLLLTGAPKDGVAKDGIFKAIGGLKDLKSTGNPTCNVDDIRNYSMKFPMRVVGFEITANTKDSVALPQQGVTQVKNTAMTFVRQHPLGDGTPSVIRPGISVKGGQFHQNQASSNAQFQFDYNTEIKLNIKAKCSITIDFYIGAIQSSAVALARKHVKARRTLFGRRRG
jgi:hypothetical protein